MNIVILGAGSVGTHLAKILSMEEHNVVVIDQDPSALEKVAQNADVATRLGSGTDWQLLEELLDLSPQLFIALSSSDETNLVACSLAKNLGYPKTVARVHHPSFLNRSRLDFSRLFFVDHFIGTEMILAYDIFKCVMNPGNVAVENFAHGAVQMRSIVIPEQWQQANHSIATLKLPENLLVGLIERKAPPGESPMNPQRIIFPRGNDLLMTGDEVTLIGEWKVMNQLHELFGTPSKEIRSVIVAGGSPVALQVCRILAEEGIQTRLIEPDQGRCRFLAEHLPRTTVLNQDPTDYPFLIAEQVHLADAFVACTDLNEKNILAAELAKQAGCSEVIALVSDASYAPLLRRLGIFYTVSEKVSVANRILAIINEDSVISVASLYDNRAKIMEVKVSSDSQIVGIPIADLSSYLPDDFLIALIENRGRIMIAKGNHILAPGDTVIVICHPKHADHLEKIF
ncbi:MAG: Trk system potassium transporter TrkA [Parachlamydiales bacterium]|nr:Trk system potassium transporter TrkA [Candidatus Acheromyda pituitae]